VEIGFEDLKFRSGNALWVRSQSALPYIYLVVHEIPEPASKQVLFFFLRKISLLHFVFIEVEGV
jgi:hypothetical protein